MPEAVLVLDPDDRIRLVNPAADELFANEPVHDGEEFRSRFDPAPPAIVSGEPVTVRLRHDPLRWLQIRAFPIGRPDPSTHGAARHAGGRILVVRDVSRERDERAQRHAFLAILSHELRTPITTIYAGSRVLAKSEATDSPSFREIAIDISAEAARLYDVVEDLLVLTRAEQGVLDMADDPVLVQRVVEAVGRVVRARTTNVPIVVEGVRDPPAVRGDPLYVEQVVRNLVKAATRFARPDDPVVVRLDTTGDEVSTVVLDRGPDPTPEDLQGSFSLSESPSGERRWGLGIGLFVCRRLVEGMRGRIWVRRREGGGAEFGFSLPRYAEAE
jgi:K+-sensing histidine kinase KdpD